MKIPSLKTRIAIAVIVIVTAVALLVTLVSITLVKQRVRQLITEQQSVLLATTVREIDQKFAIRRDTLQALANELRAIQSARVPAAAGAPVAKGTTDLAGGTDPLQEFLERHASVHVLFDNLVLFSRSGETLANLNLPASRGSGGIDTREFFLETVRLGKPLVSPPTIGLFTKKPLIALTVPIFDASGEVSMVLTGAIALNTSNFIDEITQTKIGRTGYFSVMSTNGTIILDRDRGRVLTPGNAGRPQAEGQALAGFEGTLEGIDRAGVPGLYSFKRLRTAPWILTAFYPSAEAFAAVTELEHTAFLVALAMVGLIGPLAWLFIRHQLMPLQKLHQRILAIREQPTLALIPQQYAGDEIGDLALNFDDLMRERLFAEARYQTGAEELRAATNSGLDAFFIFQAERDAGGRVTDFTIRYLNVNAERMIGMTMAELSQKSLRQSLAGHRVGAMFDKYVRVLESARPLQEEVAVANADADTDGGVEWFLHQIVPQADGVSLTARDITGRKRDEMEIRSNRAFLQSLTDHLPMLFYAKRMRADGRGEYVTWNQAAERITGMACGDVLGRTDQDLQPARVAAAYHRHDQMILADPVPLDVPETRYRRRDGTLRYLHVISVPIFDEAGRVEYIIGIGEDITERRRQERILRTSQAELQAVNDASPLGLFMTDLAGNCTYVNRTFEVMSGCLEQEMAGDAWFRSLHPDDRDVAIEGWIDAIQRREPYQNVHRFRHPDGRVVWGSFKAVPMLLDLQVSGYVGSVDDITARLEAEQALRASEERLRLLTDNIPALIAYITPDQRFDFGNRKYQRAYGLSRTDLSGMTASEVLGPDVYAQSAPYIDGALNGAAANFERLVTHVGQLRWERVSYVPDADEHGHARGFFSLVEDITELKQAQHTFAKSEMRLRMITDNLPALIAYIDRDGRYRFCNGYYETILGLKPEKVLGRKVEEVVGQKGYQAVVEQMTTVLQGTRVSFERHAKTAVIDRHFLYDYIPDIGPDGSVAGFYSMVLDITARKAAELKQAAGEKLLRTLTDNLPALVGFIDRDERFQFNNQLYAEWLNKPLSEITGRNMREVYGEKNYLLYKPYFDQALKGSKVEFEFDAVRGGTPHFFRAAYAPQIDGDGTISGVCSMISDITALKIVENQLRVMARFDSLTGLPNRNQFEEKLTEAMARGSRTKRPMAVMFLDIDHFKEINDTIGHHGGDQVLREFAQRLQRCVRKTDTVSRLAGDEFTIILEGLQADEEASVVAGKIISAMAEDFHIGDVSRTVTTSIGIAVRRSGDICPDVLLRRADEALYVAKSAGRNTFESIS